MNCNKGAPILTGSVKSFPTQCSLDRPEKSTKNKKENPQKEKKTPFLLRRNQIYIQSPQIFPPLFALHRERICKQESV